MPKAWRRAPLSKAAVLATSAGVLLAALASLPAPAGASYPEWLRTDADVAIVAPQTLLSGEKASLVDLGGPIFGTWTRFHATLAAWSLEHDHKLDALLAALSFCSAAACLLVMTAHADEVFDVLTLRPRGLLEYRCWRNRRCAGRARKAAALLLHATTFALMFFYLAQFLVHYAVCDLGPKEVCNAACKFSIHHACTFKLLLTVTAFRLYNLPTLLGLLTHGVTHAMGPASVAALRSPLVSALACNWYAAACVLGMAYGFVYAPLRALARGLRRERRRRTWTDAERAHDEGERLENEGEPQACVLSALVVFLISFNNLLTPEATRMCDFPGDVQLLRAYRALPHFNFLIGCSLLLPAWHFTREAMRRAAARDVKAAALRREVAAAAGSDHHDGADRESTAFGEETDFGGETAAETDGAVTDTGGRSSRHRRRRRRHAAGEMR